MKTMTFFELGYLDLIKALFFGKKIRLVPEPLPPGRDGAVVLDFDQELDLNDKRGNCSDPGDRDYWTFGPGGDMSTPRPNIDT